MDESQIPSNSINSIHPDITSKGKKRTIKGNSNEDDTIVVNCLYHTLFPKGCLLSKLFTYGNNIHI